MKLYPYQKKAVDMLFRHIEPNLEYKEPSYEILKAFTGAGKTIMMAEVINRLSDLDDYLCFIWVSVGKGELAKQSLGALKEFLPAHKVSFLSDEFNGGRDAVNQNEVVVLNWELVNSKNNTLMKDSERYNFKDVVVNTKARGIIPVLIIDESHRNAETDRSKVVLDMIDPLIRIDISATPEKQATVVVKYDEGRKAGIVKDNVILNKGVSDSGVDALAYMIEKSDEQYKLVKAEYAKVGGINPLMLINIPNKDKMSKDALDEIINQQAKLGRTVDNGKLALWMNDKDMKRNLDGIRDLNSPVEVLIFKQAITEGWDCPRACILVEFRSKMGETFKQQVFGRILRMPERKHYGNELLDNAYVFTNDVALHVDYADDDVAEMIKYEAKLKEGVALVLPSEYLIRDWNDVQIQDGLFEQILFDYMEENYV